MICLWPPHKRIDERNSSRAEIDCRYRGTLFWKEQNSGAIRGEVDLFMAVKVEVEAIELRETRTAVRNGINGGFGADERSPNSAAQMGRVKTSKNAVPVGVVGLPAQKIRLRLVQLFERDGVAAEFRFQMPELP